MGKKLLVLILASLLSLTASSQQYYSKNFSKEDGLPGSEVYDLLQDKDGYIWLATSFGVCRYDGYEFKTYTTKDGLADNSTISLSMDPKGRIWCSAYGGELSYFEDGRFTAHPLNNEIKKHSLGFVELFVDSLDNLYFTSMSNESVNVKITHDHQIIVNDKRFSDTEHADYTISFQPTSFGVLWTALNGSKKSYSGNNLLKKEGDTFYLKYGKFGKGNFFKYEKISENEFLISTNQWLFHIANDKVISEISYSSRVNDIYMDAQSSFWISVANDGVFQYKDKNLQSIPQRYFQGTTVSNVIQDRDKNYWFSTNGQGIFVIPSLDIHLLDFPELDDSKIAALKAFGDHIYFSNWDARLFRYNPAKNTIKRIDETYFNNRHEICSDLLIDRNSRKWIVGTDELCFAKDDTPLHADFENHGYNIIELKDGRVALASYFGLNLYEGTQRTHYSNGEGLMLRLRVLYEDNNEVLWLGTLDGLYSYSNDTYKYEGNRHPILNERITALIGNTNVLVVGTRGKGLVFVKDTVCYNISQQHGIRGNNIQSLFLENDSTLWIGTNEGLSKLSFFINDTIEVSSTNYTKWDGLPSNNIINIIEKNGILYLGTEKGLAYFNPKLLQGNHTEPVVFIENIHINNFDTIVHDTIKLKHFQNHLSVSFKGMHFKSIGNIRYKYRLRGLHEHWTYTKNIEVEFALIPPGEYLFEVYAQNANGLWSNEPAAVLFIIEKPYYKEWWFYLGFGLLLMLIVFLLIRHLIRISNRINVWQQELIQYQQQALSKQLNPHFLFNSLNSIQNFILENDKISSSNYLSKFASLMRLVLEMSNKQVVSLSDELGSLKLYLELESLRLKDGFFYTIDVDINIDKNETTLPSFIIQPFVENAIWHGLGTLKKNKQLSVIFTREDDYLVCRIQDNGIGINASKSKSKPTTKNGKKSSLGMQITQTRLDLHNRRHHTTSYIKIVDRNELNKNTQGTVVEIFISI